MKKTLLSPINIVIILFIFFSFIIAIYPEPSAKLLTPYDGWVVNGPNSSKVALRTFPVQYRHIRRSVVSSPDSVLFRTWTPDKGIVSLDIISAPFIPTDYMSVAITGASRTSKGKVIAVIQCESNKQIREVFRGSVNVNVSEAIINIPDDWCPDKAVLKLSSTENINVGIGSVFEISLLSYLKSSFVGRIPYFLFAFVIFSLVMLSGPSLAIRLGWQVDSLPVAFVSLSAFSLGIFYLSSGIFTHIIPISWEWIEISTVSVLIFFVYIFSGRDAISKAIHVLIPYAKVWFLASLMYFAILGLVSNNVGHWEPNYRFWPAIWSSDNELPWIFAEAIRLDWNLKTLFGVWLPTDRPPLMVGAHLLLAEFFALLQRGNDGVYLTGRVFNSAAIILNTLWVPAVFWLLNKLYIKSDKYSRIKILIFVGFLPFVLFNSIYGWPKAFGASLALIAFGLAWLSQKQNDSTKTNIYLFFILAAFSMLAHASTALFLAPLGLLFLWWAHNKNLQHILFGLIISLITMLSWSLYKFLILPSAAPVTKYALTGHNGFGRADESLWNMLVTRYSSLSFEQWLEIKKTMLLQVFIPVHHSVTQVWLNSDFGASSVEKLRAWDFMLLSKGNLALPLFVVIAIWFTIRALYERRVEKTYDISPFLFLIGISLFAWLTIVLVFFAPPIIHHWPQAALFGLAVGSAVVVSNKYPTTFNFVFFLVVIYTSTIWLLSPLQSALTIDIGAAVILFSLILWMCFSKMLNESLSK